jgi:DNA polymerase bacteriophage-type
LKLFIDTETYSEVPIKHGTYKYIANCEAMIATWAIDDGPVQCVDWTTLPHSSSAATAAWDLQKAIDGADEIIAHNAMFDRNVINKLHPTPIEKWRCTMVQALAHSLPGGLDKLCEVLKVPQDKAKLKEGKALVRLFCSPRPKNSKITRATRDTHPQEWDQFLKYAKGDIEAMREVHKRLPTWNYSGAELALWHLDQRINDRGVCVDLDLAYAAIEAVAKEQVVLADRTLDLTNGEVSSTTKRDALLEHILGEYLVSLPDLQGSTLERRLSDPNLPDGLRELIAIRLQASTTSTSKYKSLANGAVDGRLSGTLQFDGAGRTGRWSGRTFQPQNLPRPVFEPDEIEFGIEALKVGCADMIYDNVMQITSSAIRGCIIAPEGRKLVVADLSNIEGRVLAWLAGEQWKLNAFNDFDRGEGFDLYALAYAKSFDVSPESVIENKKSGDGSMRQIGKVQELMLGYQGGVGAFLTGAATYGFDVEDLGRRAYSTIPFDILNEAEGFLRWNQEQKRPQFGLSDTAFIVCDSIKRLWRYAHPMTEALWHGLENTCAQAVNSPGTTFTCNKFKVRRDGAWLRIGLPSGRALCYPQPQLDDGKLSYMGMDQYTRQWKRIRTYGGKLVENCCQAVARDVMAANMPRIESTGFEIVLTVHDEIICEAPDEEMFSSRLLSELMTTPNTWHDGLPLAAAGYEATRYRKD